MAWTFERRLLGAAVLAWAIVAAVNLVAGPPLGHDEAAFASVARGDAPDWLNRSRGVVALARFGLALGGVEWQLRLASAIVGLGAGLGDPELRPGALTAVAGQQAAHHRGA